MVCYHYIDDALTECPDSGPRKQTIKPPALLQRPLSRRRRRMKARAATRGRRGAIAVPKWWPRISLYGEILTFERHAFRWPNGYEFGLYLPAGRKPTDDDERGVGMLVRGYDPQAIRLARRFAIHVAEGENILNAAGGDVAIAEEAIRWYRDDPDRHGSPMRVAWSIRQAIAKTDETPLLLPG